MEDFDLPVEEFLQLHSEMNEVIFHIGYFPETNQVLTEGNIILKRGLHSKNFGLHHLWEGRKIALQQQGITTVRQVINLLITMLARGAKVYPEIKDIRTAVIKSSNVGVIITEKDLNEDYSVVTLLLASRRKPINVRDRWGDKYLNKIKKDCKTI